MTIGKRLRFEVLRRDRHTCRYCGATAPDTPLTVDHVVPTALGGADHPTNLVTACRDCNTGKASVPADAHLVDDVAAEAARWAHAMRHAATIQAAEHALQAAVLDDVDRAWSAWTYTATGAPVPRPTDWRQSIQQILDAGLDVADVLELISTAMRAGADDTWRYLCGCCWNRVKQRQQLARQLLDEGIV